MCSRSHYISFKHYIPRRVHRHQDIKSLIAVSPLTTAACHCNHHTSHTCPLDGDTVSWTTPHEADCFWEATRERGNVWAAGGCGSLIWKQWCLLFLAESMALWVMWGQHVASRCHTAYRPCDTGFWKLCLPGGPQTRRLRMSPRYLTCVVVAVVWAWSGRKKTGVYIWCRFVGGAVKGAAVWVTYQFCVSKSNNQHCRHRKPISASNL